MENLNGEKVAVDMQARLEALREARKDCQNWSINKWQEYLDGINPMRMNLTLDRVREVAHRLELFGDLVKNDTYIVTVAGTNGKGSTSALIAHTMNNLGVNVGLFTSPHLINFNERINIGGEDISDEELCESLAEVIEAQFPDSRIESAIKDLDGEDPEEYRLNYGKADCLEDLARTDMLGADGCGRFCDVKDVDDLCGVCDADDDIYPSRNDVKIDERELAMIVPYKREFRNEVVDLTYFEIITLAAVRAFLKRQCQLLVLEVGLGGRFDAVNIFYNDIAVITSIGLDHMKVLGETTQQIAYEKAGIIKPHGEVVIGSNMDEWAKLEIMRIAKTQSAKPYLEGIDFKVKVVDKENVSSTALALDPYAAHEICYKDKELSFALYFPYPRVPLSCVGLALNVIFKLSEPFGIKKCGCEELDDIAMAISTVALPGRMQLVHTKPAIYLDVAHNVPAAEHLKEQLAKPLPNELNVTNHESIHNRNSEDKLGNEQNIKPLNRRIAVMGMLQDKDVEGVIKVLKDSFAAFYVGSLPTERGEDESRLVKALKECVPEGVLVQGHKSIDAALRNALVHSNEDDVIVCLGSFVTVEQAIYSLCAQGYYKEER